MRHTLAVAVVIVLAAALAANANTVLEWNTIMEGTVASQNPFAQARIAATTQAAVFEAVNAISREFEPYLGTIYAPPGASPDAAAVAAAHGVLRGLVPSAASALDAARAGSLAAIPDGPAKDQGIAAGEAAAAASIALRAGDGSAPPAFHAPGSALPGEWQPTPTCPSAGGILLHWRNVKTFGIESSTQFRADPPPALSSSRFAIDYIEVARVGGVNSTERPVDRAEVARFYAAVLAVGTWNPAVRQVMETQDASLAAEARVLALLNMAISDALVTVMESKYHYAFWRPETAIRNGGLDDNERTDSDATFLPYIATPCFPAYPSAHASASYAARAIADRLLGEDGHSITLSNGGTTQHYTSFEQITEDIDDARVYGGIHFRFDQKSGAKQGRQIGAYLFKNYLSPQVDR